MNIRIIYTTLVVLLLVAPLGLYANNPKSADFDFGLKIGYFTPNDKNITDIYDGGLILGLEGIIWSQSGFGIGLSFERFAESQKAMSGHIFGTPIDIETEIYIIPITISALYRVKTKSSPVRPYFGGGAGLYIFTEKVNSKIGNDTNKHSFSEDGVGVHLIGGLKINKLFFEMKYSTAKIDLNNDEGDDTLDVGGFNLLAGFRF